MCTCMLCTAFQKLLKAIEVKIAQMVGLRLKMTSCERGWRLMLRFGPSHFAVRLLIITVILVGVISLLCVELPSRQVCSPSSLHLLLMAVL